MWIGPILTAIYTAGWILLYVVRPESMTDSLPRYRRGERVAAVSSTVIMSLHISLSCMAPLRHPPALAAAAASIVVFAAGVGFWFWARRLISPLNVRRRPDQAPRELVRDGAFGIVRNPLYLGMLVMAGAPLVAVPHAVLGVTWALCCLALATRAVQDEARLHDQLGGRYEDYHRAVKRRLVPLVW